MRRRGRGKKTSCVSSHCVSSHCAHNNSNVWIPYRYSHVCSGIRLFSRQHSIRVYVLPKRSGVRTVEEFSHFCKKSRQLSCLFPHFPTFFCDSELYLEQIDKLSENIQQKYKMNELATILQKCENCSTVRAPLGLGSSMINWQMPKSRDFFVFAIIPIHALLHSFLYAGGDRTRCVSISCLIKM